MSHPPVMLPPEPFLRVGDMTHLQGLRLCDAEALFALVHLNRAHLRRWLPWVDATLDVADSHRFIQSVRLQLETNQAFNAGIWHEGALAGVIGFHRIDWNNHNVEIGYWLAERHEGRGIMTNCVRVMTDYAFDELGLHRVQIRCADGNTRSRRIPERLGFIHEGLIHGAEYLNGRHVDLHIYGMLAGDWAKSASQKRFP